MRIPVYFQIFQDFRCADTLWIWMKIWAFDSKLTHTRCPSKKLTETGEKSEYLLKGKLIEFVLIFLFPLQVWTSCLTMQTCENLLIWMLSLLDKKRCMKIKRPYSFEPRAYLNKNNLFWLGWVNINGKPNLTRKISTVQEWTVKFDEESVGRVGQLRNSELLMGNHILHGGCREDWGVVNWTQLKLKHEESHDLQKICEQEWNLHVN